MKECSVLECTRSHYAKTYCKPHYSRFKKYGDPLGRRLTNAEKQCDESGCLLPVAAAGKCNGHYQRKRNNRPSDRPVSRSWVEYPYEAVNSRGYVDVVYGRDIRDRKPKHRVVMESMLGRKLVKGENVHHINGIKTDNDESNLELWTSSQPAGQRVSDKITWALEIIKKYGENPSAF